MDHRKLETSFIGLARNAVLVMCVALLAVRVGLTQEVHVRVMRQVLAPLKDRLRPDDEVVAVTRTIDVLEPDHVQTVDEIIQESTQWADAIVFVDIDSVAALLADRDTWIRTEIRGKVREVVKATRRVRMTKGEHIRVSLNGGELQIGTVLVKTEDVPKITPGRRYLLFIQDVGKPLGLNLIREPLQESDGTLVSRTEILRSTTDRLGGLKAEFVLDRADRLSGLKTGFVLDRIRHLKE